MSHRLNRVCGCPVPISLLWVLPSSLPGCRIRCCFSSLICCPKSGPPSLRSRPPGADGWWIARRSPLDRLTPDEPCTLRGPDSPVTGMSDSNSADDLLARQPHAYGGTRRHPHVSGVSRRGSL